MGGIYHICLDGYLSREIREISKTTWGCRDYPNFPNSTAFLVKLAPEGLRVFYPRDFGISAARSSIREVLGVSTQLDAWRNRPNPTLNLERIWYI